MYKLGASFTHLYRHRLSDRYPSMKLLRICRIALYCLLALCITLSTATLYYLHVQHRPSGDAQRLFDEADQLRWNDQWLLLVPIYTTGSHTIRVEGGAYAHSMTTSVTVPHFRRSSCPEPSSGLHRILPTQQLRSAKYQLT